MNLTSDSQTNVTSLRMNAGAINGIGREAGRFVVATMDIPWEITKNKLGAPPEHVVMVESVDQSYLDRTLESLPPCDTFIGIGGGQAIDTAKYFAWKRGARLISVPTILSVDAFVTPAAGIRINHDVHYIGETSPDPLIIDYDAIRTAPSTLNIAGIGDLLSMHTACFDWRHAHSLEKSEYTFSEQAIADAHAILDELYGILPEIRNVTERGMRAIVEGYMALNAICLPQGHYRVEEGSEHYLFYELEERLERPFIHGHIIGLGIYLMSRLQINQPEMITQVMDEVGLEYHPRSMQINKEDLEASLLNLPNYVKLKDKLWYTCIDDTEITPAWISEHIAELEF